MSPLGSAACVSCVKVQSTFVRFEKFVFVKKIRVVGAIRVGQTKKRMHQRYFFDASFKFVCILTWSLLVCIGSMFLSMENYSS